MITTSSTESRAAKTVRATFESGRPLMYIRTSEEARIGRVLREVSAREGCEIWTWSLTEGLRRDGDPAPAAMGARDALEFAIGHSGPAIFHLKDFHEPLRESPDVRRRLRDAYDACLDRRKFVVISSPVRYVPEELERSLLFLELRPPDIAELADFLRDELARIAPGSVTDDGRVEAAAGALQGLTLDEARYALRRGLAVSPRLEPEALPALLEEKRLLVNRGGVLEFVSDSTTLGDVGGLDSLKRWLLERRKLFRMRDTVDSEIVPKGLLMMGIPGCGKSLAVKAIASCFELPLYRIDMVEIFSGRHGNAEGAFVQACRMMEDLAPAVLWFDELEMGITSTESAGEQGRIFGFFLTWMQEKTRGLFVAATANRIDLLPAQLIRKGRFDEVFFVDLPTEPERIEIFKIHLSRRAVDPARFDLQQLMEFTVGWTGSEIEQCVVSAITRARIDEREIGPNDLIGIAAKVVPLSRTMQEQINHIRGWAFERAMRATPNPGR